MRIVVNALSARIGGGRTYLRHLFAHLPQHEGLDVLVFAPPGLDLPAHPCVRLGVPSWSSANPILRTLWERLVLPGILRRERADMLFCPGGVVATPVPAGCRVVTMFRNMMPFDAELMARMPWSLQRVRNLMLRRAMLRSMSGSDLTIFISEHARAVIESQARVAKAVTIPHGISDAFRTHGKPLPRPGAAPQGDYLLYVSRFDIYKHHIELVRAYASLSLGVRQRHPLLLLGETDFPDARRVARLIGELGLAGQVLMPGAVLYTELPAYYQHAHAVVFASSCENCPNILLEALGAGRPILCSNAAPMPEFGGDAVEYFSPFDAQDIRRALTLVLSDAPRALRLAEAAAARSYHYDWAATARYTWEQILRLRPAATEKGVSAG